MRIAAETSLYTLSLVVALVKHCHLSQATTLNAQANSNTLPGVTAAPTAAIYSSNPNEQKNFDDFRKSLLFVEPFDEKVLSLPGAHLAFVREVTRKDLVFYRQILNEAIASRNKVAPSVRLVLKYSARVLTNLIKRRREEKQLASRVEPKPEFYLMLAKLTQNVLDQSDALKKSYSKKSRLDVENFRARVEALLDYVERIISVSPLGAYMKWNKLILYKDQARNGIQNRPIVDELTDLMAQFRVMGYERTCFVVRRIINLLRLFARGVVPSSEKDVA